MGRKYASVHIISKEHEKTISIVKEYFSKREIDGDEVDKMSKLLGNLVPKQIKDTLMFAIKGTKIVLQSEEGISIYDESQTFETIEEIAKNISILQSAPVVYVTNFDDDVFCVGIYQQGINLTNLRVGGSLDAYDLEREEIDIDTLCDVLKYHNKDEWQKCFEYDGDLFELENKFELQFKAPLILTKSEVLEEKEYYQKMYNENGILYYKAI